MPMPSKYKHKRKTATNLTAAFPSAGIMSLAEHSITWIRFQIHSETDLRFSEKVHSIYESATGFTVKWNPDSITELPLTI